MRKNWGFHGRLPVGGCNQHSSSTEHPEINLGRVSSLSIGVKPCPQILPALLIDRSNGPALMPAPTTQLSIASFTHSGTGIVRMWPPFELAEVRLFRTADFD